MSKEQQPQHPIIIQPNDELRLTITGAEYAAIDAAVKKLPYEVAAPLLAKLEQQIIAQKENA